MFNIVIPVHDQPECLERCLSALKPSIETNLVKVIVVDNGSKEDKTLEILDTSVEWATVIKMGKNTGFAEATNAGLSIIKEGHAVWLNSDCILPSNWLKRATSFVRSHPDVGAFGPRSNNGSWAGGGKFNQKIQYNKTDSQEDIDNFSASLLDNTAACTEVNEFGIWGFCMVVPESSRKKIGLIDPAFIWGGWEDHDYCARIIESGMKVLITNTFFAYHYGSKTINSIDNFWELASGNHSIFLEKRRLAKKKINALTLPIYKKVVNRSHNNSTNISKYTNIKLHGIGKK